MGLKTIYASCRLKAGAFWHKELTTKQIIISVVIGCFSLIGLIFAWALLFEWNHYAGIAIILLGNIIVFLLNRRSASTPSNPDTIKS